jgi:hypothetical protein
VCGAAAHPQDRTCPACGAALAADEPSLYDELLPPGDDPGVRYDERGVPYDDRGVAGDDGVAYDEHGVPYARSTAGHEVDDRPRRGGALAPVVLLVGVAVLGLLVWWLLPGRGGDDTTVAAGPSTSATPSGDAASETPTSTPSPAASGPSGVPTTPGSPRAIRMATGSTSCGDAGSGALAWSGNDVTSCEFALETATALSSASATLPATVTATSPVTKKDYTMACENTTPVRCTGGNDAVVYVQLPQ